MIRAITRILVACCALLLGVPAIAAEAPQVKVGTLKFGTVNWELEVIGDGLDEKHGFALTRVDFADKDATSIALQSGDVDVIVTDWIWVATQRKLGHDFTFVPFSRSVGAVMVGSEKGHQDRRRPRRQEHRRRRRAERQELGAAAGLCDARPPTWSSRTRPTCSSVRRRC